MLRTMIQYATAACLMLLCTQVNAQAAAAIVIAPAVPEAGEPVRISLVQQYGSAASVTSATLTRDGNRFVIAQTVDVACILPSAPVLTSSFDVGPLTAGSYEVEANITRVTTLPQCVVSNESRAAGFEVTGIVDPGPGPGTGTGAEVVPASGLSTLFALALLVATLGVFGIRRSR